MVVSTCGRHAPAVVLNAAIGFVLAAERPAHAFIRELLE